MTCKWCGSEKRQHKLSTEVAIHVPDISKPHVFIFPHILICSNCGKAEFVEEFSIAEDKLRLLDNLDNAAKG